MEDLKKYDYFAEVMEDLKKYDYIVYEVPCFDIPTLFVSCFNVIAF